MPDIDSVKRALHCRGQDLMIDPPACDQCEYHFEMPNGSGCDFRRLCRDAAEMIKSSKLVRTEHALYTVHEPKEQKFLVDSDGKITPLPVVVRCKDCKWRGTKACFCKAEVEDTWFCSEGERKEGR